jgi:hypothetical protein
MRFSVGGRGSVAGTSARAIASLFGSATFGARIREIGVSNTTTTAVAVALQRFSAATNVGAGLTENAHDINPAQCTAFAGHTADGTTSGSPFRQVSLGSAIGAGWAWTFGDNGLVIPVGTANGLGIVIPTGTGQILDFYFEWEE